MLRTLKILFVLLFSTSALMAQISTKEVSKLLKKHDIKYPEIVLSQFVLETGWGKSNACINRYNLFGFKNGKENMRSYERAVIEYKRRVQSRLRPDEDYYSFLIRIKYAKDPKYIWKLKSIQRKLRNS